MDAPAVKELALYLRAGRWRFSIFEDPPGRACGTLPSLGEEATFQEAEAAFVALVRRGYDLPSVPVWREDQPEWWTATISPGAP